MRRCHLASCETSTTLALPVMRQEHKYTMRLRLSAVEVRRRDKEREKREKSATGERDKESVGWLDEWVFRLFLPPFFFLSLSLSVVARSQYFFLRNRDLRC